MTGPDTTGRTVHAPAPALETLSAAMVGAMGADAAEAAIVARHLVEANLTGHDSHGVGLLPFYARLARDGLIRPGRPLEVVREAPAHLLVDAGLGFGQRAAREAMDMAIGRARESGVCALGLRNAAHIGRVGAYGEQAVAAGLASIHFVNVAGHRPLVAPFGGSDGRLVTNPFCAAVPGTGSQPPVVLDFATSKVALGKVRVALNKGERMAPGTLIDKDGRPSDDPAVMFAAAEDDRGAILPFGDHKGYGMALACELFAAALTGGLSIHDGHPRRGGVVNNMLAVLFSPDAFGGGDGFRAEVEAIVRYVTASPPAPGVDAVLVAGDPERRMRAARGRDGIPLDPRTWTEIREAAVALGIPAESVDGTVV